MSWAGGPDGNGGGPPHDGLASGRDRLGRVRARLAGGASRLRWRALRLWQGRTAPRPAPDRPPEPEARGGQGRRGSLRGRLLWSFVGVAALAALIVGVVTLSLLRVTAARSLEQQLSDQAEAAAVTIGEGPRPCTTVAALRAVQTELYLVDADGAPHLVTCALLRDGLRDRLRNPAAPAPDIDLRAALGHGSVTTGSRGGIAYALAPLRQPVQDLSGVQYQGVVLTHSLGGLGVGLVGGVAWRLLLATALAVAIAALVAWLLAGRLTAPLRRLAGAARELGGGELSTRVEVQGDDEVAEVGTAFNEMAADIEQSQGEQRAFLASVSHELKTPLTAVQGYTEALLDGTVSGAAERQRTLQRIHGETLRLARLVQDLIDLARLGRGQFAVSPVDADVAAVLREAVGAAAERAAAQGVSVEQQVPDTPLLARVDPGRLRQVLDNLLDNAARSSPTGYPVLVAARPLAGGWVEVAVVDRGPGIAAEDLPRAFDRGYLWSRYRGTRTVGSGLGLAIVKALCDAMGVTVRAESGREYGRGGTAFRLALPPARSSPASWAASGHGLPTPR